MRVFETKNLISDCIDFIYNQAIINDVLKTRIINSNSLNPETVNTNFYKDLSIGQLQKNDPNYKVPNWMIYSFGLAKNQRQSNSRERVLQIEVLIDLVTVNRDLAQAKRDCILFTQETENFLFDNKVNKNMRILPDKNFDINIDFFELGDFQRNGLWEYSYRIRFFMENRG